MPSRSRAQPASDRGNHNHGLGSAASRRLVRRQTRSALPRADARQLLHLPSVSNMSRDDRWLEFPAGAAPAPDPLSRRDFVSLVGASIALAGVTGCVRKPDREILSYIDTPPEVVP